MNDEYSIFKKIFLVFANLNNPYLVLFDKLGLKNRLLYRTHIGTKFLARPRTTDINEGIAILSGTEYPKNILNISSKKSPVIIDAGAHIGIFSLYAKFINSSARIFAIEPLNKNVINMRKNFSLNKIKDVIILQYALSEKKHRAKLWLSNNKFDNATISLSRKRRDEDSFCMVQTVTLGEIIKNNYITKIDVLKMDIEGVEYQVLKESIKLITENVERLLVEYHTDSDIKMKEKIKTILARNKFRLIFEHRHILGFLNKKFDKE